MTDNNHIFMPENHMDELYNSGNFLVRFVHRDRLNQIIKAIPRKNCLKILDAGCGEGHLIEKMHSNNNTNKYYGIDITDIALKKAKERCTFADIRKMDITKIDFEDEFFDVVICTETLEHIFEFETALKELKLILKKDGFLILTFPNEILWTIGRTFLGRRPIKIVDHVNAFNPKTIRSLIKMKEISSEGLPFKLPFFISLGYLMKFKKE